MLLAVDAGNTNVTFAVYGDDGKLKGEWRSSTKGARTADEYAVWLGQLFYQNDLTTDDIDNIIIATVVPAGLFDLQNLARKSFNCEPRVVGDDELDLGLEVKVDKPGEVGSDRLVNAVAAHDRYGGPLIIVDFGTATTFDVIDATGAYAGGVIAPGINLSAEALHLAAAQLPRIAVERPDRVVGTDTVSAMKSGIFWGYIGMIEGMVARIGEEVGGEALKVVATGGLSALFADHTPIIELADGDLTLHGLWLIHQRNRP